MERGEEDRFYPTWKKVSSLPLSTCAERGLGGEVSLSPLKKNTFTPPLHTCGEGAGG